MIAVAEEEEEEEEEEKEAATTQQETIFTDRDASVDPLVDPFDLSLESDDEMPASENFISHDPILS